MHPSGPAMAALTWNPQFQKLQQWHCEHSSDLNLRSLFEADKESFNHSSLTLNTNNDIVCWITPRTCDGGHEDAGGAGQVQGVQVGGEPMFSGKISYTEDWAILHIALRNWSNTLMLVVGKAVMPEINRVLDMKKSFCQHIWKGNWEGNHRQRHHGRYLYQHWSLCTGTLQGDGRP